IELVHRTSIRERKSGNTLTERNIPSGKFLRVLADYVTSRRVTFVFVVEVDHASVERNYVSYFVDENLECVFNVERGAERTRDLIKRIHFAMRILDLVVSDV